MDYLHAGIRASKTVNGTKHTYVYASGKLLRETYGDTTIDFFYSTSGQPYALSHNGTVYYYITNLQGDVMSIVDGLGAVVAEYEYDPYGNIISATGALAEINPLRYRGYVYDQECSLYYLQSRYYDPGMGRFLNADAAFDNNAGIIGYNLFSYCANSPTRFKDSSGFGIETVLDIISVLFSLWDLISRPSWVAVGYLAWDVAAAVIPFIPASYVAKGSKLIFKIAGKIDDLADGSDLLVGTYRQLKKMVKGVKNVEIHHLIEKRFSALFSSKADDFLSIALTPDMHRTITNRWRNLHKLDGKFKNFAYGSDYTLITYDLMVNAVKEVYHDMPAIRDVVLEWLEKNWRR